MYCNSSRSQNWSALVLELMERRPPAPPPDSAVVGPCRVFLEVSTFQCLDSAQDRAWQSTDGDQCSYTSSTNTTGFWMLRFKYQSSNSLVHSSSPSSSSVWAAKTKLRISPQWRVHHLTTPPLLCLQHRQASACRRIKQELCLSQLPDSPTHKRFFWHTDTIHPPAASHFAHGTRPIYVIIQALIYLSYFESWAFSCIFPFERSPPDLTGC